MNGISTVQNLQLRVRGNMEGAKRVGRFIREKPPTLRDQCERVVTAPQNSTTSS